MTKKKSTTKIVVMAIVAGIYASIILGATIITISCVHQKARSLEPRISLVETRIESLTTDMRDMKESVREIRVSIDRIVKKVQKMRRLAENQK